jgi:hypothetical protein
MIMDLGAHSGAVVRDHAKGIDDTPYQPLLPA